jgi:hypothetical protein
VRGRCCTRGFRRVSVNDDSVRNAKRVTSRSALILSANAWLGNVELFVASLLH